MDAIERLQDTHLSGRPETPRFRQLQLQSLHRALRTNASDLLSALALDNTGCTPAEVDAEFFLAVDAVRRFYEGIDFEKCIKDEYAVVGGRDNQERRVGAGVVVIRPGGHTRLFSVTSPLAAAVAGGCCVVLELQDSLLNLDALLRKLLPSALDPNVFCISNAITSPSILSSSLIVDQTSSPSSSSSLSSPSSLRTLAIVDRTADVESAARAITSARFAYAGMSPYAPDLVLVNEYVKKAFFEACSRYASLTFARETGGVKRVDGNASEETRRAVEEAEGKRVAASFGSSDFKLVDVKDRDATIANIKIKGRFLPIVTCTSLLDAAFNTNPPSPSSPLLATYIFAAPDSAKYLAQHLPAHVSLINQIPRHLLIGPAAPASHAPDLVRRYTTAMFTVARPQLIEPVTGELKDVERLLDGGDEGLGEKLRGVATKELKGMGQPRNDFPGFFEVGFMTGLGITASVVLPLVGYATYVLGRRGVEYALKMRA